MKLAACTVCSTVRVMSQSDLQQMGEYGWNLHCVACGSWGFFRILQPLAITYENGVGVRREIILDE